MQYDVLNQELLLRIYISYKDVQLLWKTQVEFPAPTLCNFQLRVTQDSVELASFGTYSHMNKPIYRHICKGQVRQHVLVAQHYRTKQADLGGSLASLSSSVGIGEFHI